MPLDFAILVILLVSAILVLRKQYSVSAKSNA